MAEIVTQKPHKVGVHSFAFGDVIGRGAFSKVMIARRKDTSEYYAIKVVSKSFIKREGYINEAMAERNALTIVDHPFVIKLYFSFQDRSNLYYVTPLCRYGTLWDLEKAVRLPGRGCDPELVRFYMAEVVSAVYYLHTKAHLIHRDVKPENILVSESGHLLLSDFGSVISIENAQKKNIASHCCGTIQYLAPETRYNEMITPAVDTWSMGCMLYLLLTGMFLFEGEDEVSIIEKIQSFSPESLCFPDYVSSDAQDLIKKMLICDPLKRIKDEEILKHPYFKSIDFDKLQYTKPPYIPPFIPLPVICDDEIENELNALRGSIDETYRKQQEERMEAIVKLLQDEETCLYSSPVVQVTSGRRKNRMFVLTSMRRLLILDSQISSIKTDIDTNHLVKVEVTSIGFTLSVNFPRKTIFRFATPYKDQSVWCNCIQRLINQRKELATM